jgi:hypothetical protein
VFTLTELIAQAEHLLWVIARLDVEGLSAPRTHMLGRLQVLEQRARELGVTDLYSRVLQQAPSLTKIVL